MNKWILLIVVLVLSNNGIGQQQKNDIIQQRIEFIAEELDAEDVSLEDVFNMLYYYYDHPINLNAATKTELIELMLLSDIQINELLKRVEEKGPFTSLYELQEMEYWDLLTIENVTPFVRLAPIEDKKESKLKDYLKDGKTEAFFRWQRVLEDKDGYEDVPDSVKKEDNSYYWGSPDKLYSRIRYTHKNDLSVGVTMEKDAGEQLFGETQPNGFDYYSGHAFYSGNKFIRKAAVGDYQMEIGQGIALWTGYAFNKTVDATNIKKNARGIRPYASVDETRFLRGAAVEFGVGNFSLTTFGSRKGVDGSIQVLDTLDGEEARLASSINLSGFHRTNSELERKNSVTETIIGSNLKFESTSFQAGITAINHNYDTPFERADRLVNKYEFSGTDLLSLSADYSFVYENVSVFGEVAQSRSSGSVGVMQGAVLALGRRAAVSAAYRNYPKDYHTLYARGFAESSRPINESGLYIGGTFKLNDSWSLNTYADIFKRPWLAFRVDAPSEGHEVLGQLKYRPNPRLEVFFRVREQNKMQNAREYEGNIRPVEEFLQRVYRVSFNYKLSKNYQWKTRLDYVIDQRESIGKQEGVSLAQDLIYKSPKLPVRLALRYAIFDTDGFDARIYAYEYNLQNVFSIPTYFNEGSRYYAMIQYTFWNNRCDLWLRYAAFVYANQGSLGNGPERVEGNIRSEFGFQLRVKL